ncbi:hypothetical protein B0T16DRAFT_489282 [Cercophora newfieldiana]|uniref:Uncharacterized protein n=1 Tax=Cercophora newfieldiana TaxID=92897 RepID=A0AA39YEL6_9PEZI|nr:hypothetical protein B0T16DRAFT_489282 [Cercophora newfieldiana]
MLVVWGMPSWADLWGVSQAQTIRFEPNQRSKVDPEQERWAVIGRGGRITCCARQCKSRRPCGNTRPRRLSLRRWSHQTSIGRIRLTSLPGDARSTSCTEKCATHPLRQVCARVCGVSDGLCAACPLTPSTQQARWIRMHGRRDKTARHTYI